MVKSPFLANAQLNGELNNIPFDVTQPFVALHTGDPGTTGANELVGGSYARQAGSFGSAASASANNDALIEFTDLPAATITHCALWTAAGGGNMLRSGPLAEPKTVGAGDTGRFPIGSLVVTEQ